MHRRGVTQGDNRAKESGIGREGGQEGIDAYLEAKYVSMSL